MMLREDGLILLAAGAAVGLWMWATQARESVDRVSRRICEELALQRLDDAVTLRRLRLVRTPEGLRMERLFSFEFSVSGADRCRGEVCLQGQHPVWAHLDHPDGAIHLELP